MPKIDLLGVDPSGASNIGEEALTKPAPGANLHWYFSTPFSKNYSPYLIKATDIDDDTLTFRGVNLEDPDTDFGPDNSHDYVIDLSDLALVWRDKPSTLNHLDPNDAKRYAVLFMSTDFVNTTNDPDGKLNSYAKGGPKYPQAASGTYEKMLKENAALKNTLSHVLEKYEKSRNAIKAILGNKSRSEAPELQKWLDDNALDETSGA